MFMQGRSTRRRVSGGSSSSDLEGGRGQRAACRRVPWRGERSRSARGARHPAPNGCWRQWPDTIHRRVYSAGVLPVAAVGTTSRPRGISASWVVARFGSSTSSQNVAISRRSSIDAGDPLGVCLTRDGRLVVSNRTQVASRCCPRGATTGFPRPSSQRAASGLPSPSGLALPHRNPSKHTWVGGDEGVDGRPAAG